MRGYIYILINESFREDLVKIGKTSRTPEERVDELYTTGIPEPFTLTYSEYFNNVDEAEKFIHKYLEKRNLRNLRNREFFNISQEKAKDIVISTKHHFDGSDNLIKDIFEWSDKYELGINEYDFDNVLEIESCYNSPYKNDIFYIPKAISLLNNLKVLCLENSYISDISSINTLDLEKLSLSSNYITDISSISNMNSLKELSLSNNYIKDIAPLKNLKLLEKIYLYNNQIQNIRPIFYKYNLTHLDLSNNNIYFEEDYYFVYIEFLCHIPSIIYLDLSSQDFDYRRNFYFPNHLPENSSLKKLYIECLNIDDETIQRLEENFPLLNIYHECR